MFGLFQRGAAAIKDWATNDIWDYISRRPATQEKLKAGPGAKIPYFMPYLDENQTAGETAEIRAAYRRMLADPDVKAAWLNKLLGVMALDLNIRPYKKKHPRHKIIADFVKWNLTTRLYEGVPGLIWDVLSGATIDGWSLCEPKWVVQDNGEYRGKLVLQRLKAKDVWQDLVPLVDEHRNIVSIRGLRYNDGTEYSPKDFVIYTHLGMYENPIGTSDFRAAYASWWFLDTVTKLRAMGAERRALPIVMGEYPSTDKQSALETALSAIKWRNWIAVPKDVKLQAIDMAGKADEIFGSFTRDLRERIWIGLDGATLQSMQSAAGAVRGNSQVHKDTADLRKWYLSAAITHVLNDYEHGIIREMVDANFVGAEGYPTASLGGVDAAELKEDLAIAQGLQQMGWIHSREEIEDRFSWPWGEGDDALQMPQQGMGGMGGIGGLFSPSGGDPAGGMDPAGGGDEDPRVKADPIADILGGLYGEKADAALGGGPDEVETYAEEDWVHAPGPRSQNRWRQLRTGRIEYSVENPGKHEGKSLPAEAKDKRPEIRKAAVELVEKLRSDASARTPENAKALVDHLGKLTIAEIHEIKRQYGLKAGASWKSALVEKVADRLQNGMPARQDRARKDRWKDPSDGQEQESTTTLPQEVMEHLQNHAKTLDTQIKTEEATLAKEIEDARKRGLDVGSPPSDGRGTSAGDQGTPREDRAAPSGAGQIEKDPDPHGGRGGVDRDAFIAERVRAAKTGVKSLSGRKEAEKKARAEAEAEWDAKQKPAGDAGAAKEPHEMTKAEWDEKHTPDYLSAKGKRAADSKQRYEDAHADWLKMPSGRGSTKDAERQLDRLRDEYAQNAKDYEGGKKEWDSKAIVRERRHRSAIIAAIDAGKPVPPEVLADYPDLAEKYGKKPTAAKGAKQSSAVHENLIEYTVRELFKKKSLDSAVRSVVKKFNGFENILLGGKVSVTVPDLRKAVLDRVAVNAIKGAAKMKEGMGNFSLGGSADQFNIDERVLAEHISNHEMYDGDANSLLKDYPDLVEKHGKGQVAAGDADPVAGVPEAKEAASPTKAYDAVLQAVANAGSPVVDLSDLRKQMPEGMQGEEFNAAVLALADDQKLSIAQDSDPGKWSPEERAGFVTEGDKVYTTASVHPSYTPEKETSKVKAGGEGDAGSWLTEYSGLSDAQSKLKWHQKVNDSLATQGNGPKIGDSFKLKDGRTATVSLKGEAKNGQPVFGLDVADHALRLPGTSGGAGKKDRIAERPASDLLLMGWKPDAGPTPATEKPNEPSSPPQASDEVQNTGDAEKEPVNYANVVTIAADNVSKLRKQDVYRVLDAMRSPEELTGMSEYLLANRPDLEEMIRDNEQEIHHERGYHGEQQLLENRGGGSDQSGLPSGQPVGSVTGEPRQQISSEAQGGAGSGRGLERVPTSQGVGGDGRGSDTGEAGGRSAASELDGQVRDAAGSAERGGLRGSAGDGGDDASAGRIPSEVARAPFKYKDRNFLPVGKKGKFWANIAALKLAKELDAEGREATDEERETLSKYSGWGQFPAVFNEYGNPEDLDGENPREWTKERTALKAILGDDEYRSASKSTLNAHYTEPAIVDLQWKLAERLGFKGGQGNRFLEPSAGVGYYLGMMPDHLRQGTKVTAVEKDAGTGSILKSLYPSDRIEVKGYEEHKAPNDFYDMAASNVPFGDYGVHDKKYDKHNANIHDYFFLKSLDQVRPGGLLMHVTSAGTLDKANRSIREAIAEKADLVGAIRLPAGTHKQAGTDVVTDMLVFKKREHGEPHGDKTWLDTTTVPDPAGGEPIPVNAYFAAHPEQVIGQIDRSGKMYHGAQVSVSRPDDFEARLEKAVENFPKDVMTPRTAPRSRFSPEALPAAGHVKDGGFTIQNGKVFRREGDSMTEQRMSAEQTARLGGLMAVRDAARQVINDQVAGKSPVESQAKLSQIYDKFVKAYGPLNSKDNRKIYQGDPDAYLIQSIEHYDDESKTARKGVFFSKETVSPAIDPTKVENVSDGVGVSLNRSGRLDVDHIAKLTGRTVADVSYELTSKGLAFQDPAGDKWHPADYYLSGNVKAKLRDAEEAAKTDPKYRANVEALKKVQPPDKHHEDIVVKIGAPWIPASDMANFAATLLGGRADHFDIANTPGGGWTASYTKTGKDRHWSSKIANSQWGTADKRFIDLLELTLNSRSAKITRTDDEGKTYTDVQATQDAQLKQEAIREAFKEWIWTDDERRERLAKHFNDHFNTTVDFNPDGSHLTLPGTTMEVRPHVKDFIWRTVTQGRSLGGHEVGMGKTRAMAGSAMELRRMGLAKKPAIACLKANVEAVTREAQEMYPGAKIISTVDMFSADKRKSTIARIATGDYDMVIMTHDNLDMIQMLPETRKKYIEQELNEIKTALVQANKSSNDGGYRRGKPQKSNIVKQLEKQLERKEVALKDAIENGRKDDVVYFEELGIDHLIVDEAHKYKNAPVYTQMDNVKGISSQPSDRATNMLMRTQYLLEKHNGRGVTFMTGTPMANSISELYNVQRYLQPDLLKEQGLNSFDAWASTFTEPKTSWEFTPAGEYKPVTRLVKFANVSNLMAGARQVLDVQKIDDINAKSRAKGGEDIIKRPKPTVIPHQAPNTPAQKKLMETIVARAKAIKGQKPGVPGADNMLAICTDGAKGALDLRLLDANAADDPQSKVNIAIGNVLDIYKAKPGKTQLIFSDLGVNPMENGFHLYADIINKLVAGGIPRHEIADFSKLDGAKKEAAQAAMKKGQIRIGIGGTDKLGTGVNVQTLLSDVHHLDTPYVPASIEQRDGRAHRQGNTNAEIGVHRYVTAGSLDQFRWTLVSKKKAMIDQVVRPGTQVSDVIEEPDTEEVTPEMMEALASDNPLLMKKISIDHDLKTLTDKSKAHAREQARLRKQVDVAERTEVPTLTKAVERMKGHVAHFDSHGSGFEMKIGDKTYTDRKEAAEAWKEVMDRPSGQYWRPETLGHYKGFDITRTGGVVRLQAPDGETYGTTGGLSHIEAIGRRIGNDIAEHEGRIVTLKAEAEKLKRDIGKPFAKAKELEEMQAQSRDIEQQLQAASRPKVEEGGVPVSAQASQDPAWHEEILQLLRKGDRVSAVKVMRENNPGKSDLELQPLATKLMKRAKEE